uniref:Intraflagellar transport protein 140 homolog n=1 Tax=Phallusia mammillata TaxID=59560 RepID=A0A6F9DEB2_9ASCI|nr:intraflagellar transport protein 140 homolog [Phallusia mammillata]
MALYFDFQLDCPPSASAACLSWHDQQGLLAVCFSLSGGTDGIVKLYNRDGGNAHQGVLMQRAVSPTSVTWHPTKKIVAVGWENGEILIWNDQQKELYEVPRLHTKGISALEWTNQGTRLASGDKEGVFAVWKCDARGRVQHDPLSRHDLGPAVTDCIVRPGPHGAGDIDMKQLTSLAKAAISGDESAFDMLEVNQKMDSRMRVKSGRKEGLSFYVGTSDGVVYHIDEKGVRTSAVTLDSSVQQLLYCNDKDFLVAASCDLQVVKCLASSDGQVEEKERVKFSGKERSARLAWASPGLLVAATADQSLRLWDLISGDNYTLLLDEPSGFARGECIIDVSCLKLKGVIAAGTDQNRIAIWKLVPHVGKGKFEPEDKWKLQTAVKINVPCGGIKWCLSHPVLAIGSREGALVLAEEKSKMALSATMVAVQTGPRHIAVDFIGHKPTQQSTLTGLGISPTHTATDTTIKVEGHMNLDVDMAFNGMSAASENVAVWNGKQLAVYEVTKRSQSHIGMFECDSHTNALHDQSVFCIESPKDSKDRTKIQARNFQGTVKQLIHFQESEGDPTIMSVSGDYLAVGTSTGCIRVYDLTRRDAKPHCSTKSMADMIEDFGSLQMVVCNRNGSKVAVICMKDNGVPDSRVYIYDTELDKVESFDFTTGKNDQDEYTNDLNPKSDIEQSRADAASEVAGRYPTSVHWDATESRMLTCEAQITDPPLSVKTKYDFGGAVSTPPPQAEVMIVTLFTTQDHGLMLQGSFERNMEYDQLVGHKVPYFYFTKSIVSPLTPIRDTDENEERKPEETSVYRKTMRDFVGLDDCDNASISAMLDFSYYLTIGDMDEAFKAIKLIKGTAVWESMAQMCVKTRRLDVAKVCLANMGNARGARALKEVAKEPQRDARIARLALELGMNDEAEKLYINCGRYDLLNVFYQAIGEWKKALDTAEQHDRINLRSTYYKYAKHLETSGDITGAIPNFEKSGTHYFEVPRMLFDESEMLEGYIMKTKDRKLRKWWAQYMESTGDMETAIKFYQQAADPLSLVRVYCYCGNSEKAAEVANETGDKAACYHLARQFENNDDIKQAIHFFTRAMAYGNAIRICKEHGFEDQLMNLALLSTPTDMVEAAAYYEDRPDTMDKAVMLYHKAGHFSKALELAFESKQFGALELISQELDEKTDPVLLERCADFFMEHGQHDRAVAMLVVAKKYSEAINICSTRDVRLNEDLVTKLTVPKGSMDPTQRDRLHVQLADCCMKQGEYHLACRIYTQAGDKERAMRALLKSGDTEKIMFFAGVSRSRNIYVMAANYLQSLDWRKDPEIMKGIINFYTKGRALDSLAGFYDACAQVEIDEYQNYDKAIGALTEALKCLTKAKMADRQLQESKVSEVKGRIALIKKFTQTRRLFETNAEEALKQCQALLSEHDLESSVRYGDVYGLLIEYHASQDNFDRAYQCVQDLRARVPSINLSYYVSMRTLEAVHRAVGVPLGRGVNYANGDAERGAHDDMDDDDEVTEELYDDDSGPYGFR